MPSALIPERIADDVLELQVSSPGEAQKLAQAIRAQIEAEDIVAGLDRVSVRFDPSESELIVRALQAMTTREHEISPPGDPIEIGVSYGGEDGPDLEDVASALGLTKTALIEAHTAQTHTVEMIGFTPGFSYLSGLSESFAVPRLSTPRPRVSAGSVGITAGYTGIYALQGPGGWPLIGKTEAPLFNANRKAPFLLTPGQRVKFRAL